MNSSFFRKKVRYILAACILFLSAALPAQLGPRDREVIDSLENVLHQPDLPDDKLYAAYERLSEIYDDKDGEKSLDYAWKGFRLAEKRRDDYQIANFYFLAGTAFYYVSKIDSAFYFYEKALSMLTQLVHKEEGNQEKLDILQMKLLNNSGALHFARGNFDLALDHYLKSLVIGEKLNKPEQTVEIYINVAEIHTRLKNTPQAEAYLLKSEQIYRQLGDSTGIAETYLRMSSIYYHTKDYTKALEYAEESYRMLSALPTASFYNLFNSTSRLASIWLMIPDYNKALEYALKNVEYAEKTNNQERMSAAFYTLSQCYLRLNKYREAEETAFRALETDSSNIYINSLQYANIAMANIRLKNSEKAIEYFQKTVDSRENYSSQNYQASLAEMSVKYETEKKELQIAVLKEEKHLVIWLSVAGCGLLLLGLSALFLLWRWTVQKRRLAEQQHAIAQAHIIQIEQEKQLIAAQAVLDGEVQERSRLAHSLHDGLGSMLTGVKLNLELLKGKAPLDADAMDYYDKAMMILDHSMVEMRRVAHHLMPETLDRYGLKAALSGFLNSIPSVEFAWYGSDDRLEDPKKELIIYRIIHELVNNALKHSGATKIGVNVMHDPDYLAFTVFDNGCGFDALTEFQGMGLPNIRKRLASCNGRMEVNSKEGEGTEINVELRIKN